MEVKTAIQFALMGIGPKDAQTLMQAGYTPEDCKEIKGITPSEDGKVVVEEKKEEPKKEEPEVDYKALYEAEQKKVQDLQQANINKDIPASDKPEVSDKDIMANFIQSCI